MSERLATIAYPSGDDPTTCIVYDHHTGHHLFFGTRPQCDRYREALAGGCTPEQADALAHTAGDGPASGDDEIIRGRCAWYCTLCRRCHANACPSLWSGGSPEVPCGHGTGTNGNER